MKVTAILKGMIDQNGHQPIQIRIADGIKRTYKPTGIKINPELFKEGRVTPKHPKYKELNKTLETLIIQHQAEALSGFEKKIPKTDAFTFIDSVIENLTRGQETLRQYGSQVTKLKEFAPTLFLTDINKDFLNRYKAFLKKRGNEGNTIWAAFKFVRKFVKLAKTMRLIEENPFDNYEFPKYIEPDKNYLTSEELKEYEKQVTSKGMSEKLREAGTWFLIACDTGMRISDIENFDRKKHIVGDRLIFKTKKGKEMVGLPIDAKLRKLFERVDYKRLSMHRNTYNELIKIIAAAAGIDKHISTHTARHTAAMSLANDGISQELTAKILGHKDMRATATYYKISNPRVDMELKKRKR